MEMARCMLHARNMDPKFWAEAINVASYIINRSPTIAVKHKIHEEAWSGRKTIVGHFKFFGCDAYVHIPEEKRKKLDKKSHKCIMVGYSESFKAYMLYDHDTNKILIRRDVIFDEIILLPLLLCLHPFLVTQLLKKILMT